MPNPTIVAVLAVRNRAKQTESCIRRLISQKGHFELTHIVVVDDGSTDETEAVLKTFGPRVKTIKGNGELYWAGAMRLGARFAQDLGPNLLLWVNDDAELHEQAIETLIDTYNQSDPRSIIGGTFVSNEDSTKQTYGGQRQVSRRWYQLSPIGPSDVVEKADALNGNFVLIPRETYAEMGGIDPIFTHHYADWDFTLRASRAGIPVLVAPGVVGMTARNSTQGSYMDAALAPRDRLRALFGPKGAPPRELGTMLRRYASMWPVELPYIYTRALFHVARPSRPRMM